MHVVWSQICIWQLSCDIILSVKALSLMFYMSAVLKMTLSSFGPQVLDKVRDLLTDIDVFDDFYKRKYYQLLAKS